MTVPLGIVLNGEPRRVEPGVTVARLVAEIAGEVAPEGVAAAVNGEVVPRPQWRAREIRDGDNVEIVRAVAGG